MSVDSSVSDLLWMDHRLVWAPTIATYKSWVAAGKPCLRRSCGHHRGSHIASEGMECSECDCPGFVDFAHPDDSGITPSRALVPYRSLPNRSPVPRRRLTMTVIVAESIDGTGDLGAVGTNGTACGYLTPAVEAISSTTCTTSLRATHSFAPNQRRAGRAASFGTSDHRTVSSDTPRIVTPATGAGRCRSIHQ